MTLTNKLTILKNSRAVNSLVLASLLLLASLTLATIVNSGTAHAATITVDSKADTTTQDDGECTLREAINNANFNLDTTDGGSGGDCTPGDASPTRDTIEFNITGAGDYSIEGQDGYILTPGSDYSDITELVTLDAYSQPGATPNSAFVGQPFNGSVLITLDMSSANNSYGALLAVAAPGTIVSGFSIVNSVAGGIAFFNGSDGGSATGNLIGVYPDGTIGGNQSAGIGIIESSEVTIGGGVPAERNVISANGASGLGNIYISITGNGVSTGNIVQGNYIGTDITGKTDSTFTESTGTGINASAGSSNGLIGGTDPQEANIIAGNRGGGVVVSRIISESISLDVSATGYSILGNSIHSTVPLPFLSLTNQLGIEFADLIDNDGDSSPDLFISGPTLNDPLDPDTGANNYINFPVLNSISQSGSEATINYSLDAADSPTDQYRVEFFGNDEADPSGYGEGQTFLGAITTTNGNNQQTSLTLPSGYNLTGKSVSATTTAIDNTTQSGFGSTSEFAKNIQLATATNTSLAVTGGNSGQITIGAISLVTIGGFIFLRSRFMLQ